MTADTPARSGNLKRKMKSAARLYAVQALFQMEKSEQSTRQVVKEFLDYRFGATYDGDEFLEGDVALFEKTIGDAVNYQATIDQMTDRALVAKWPIARIDPTLRGLFRAAGAEMTQSDTPPKVVISEYVDIARAFFGDVDRLASTTRRVNPQIHGEDVATMLLSHAGGVTSVVDCSYATRREPETFPQTLIEIDGTDGTLRLDAGYRLTVQSGGKENVRDVSPPLLAWAERPWHNIQESVRTIQQHFVDCLAEGRQPETSGADNLKTLALVEAAYRSAETGRTVEIAAI